MLDHHELCAKGAVDEVSTRRAAAAYDAVIIGAVNYESGAVSVAVSAAGSPH